MIKTVLILTINYNSLFLSHLNYGITEWGFNVGQRIKTSQKGNQIHFKC